MRTSELAALAGVTIRALRHYHRIGLLEEPDRTADDKVQDQVRDQDQESGHESGHESEHEYEYDVRHLARLLRITRLTELGVPLADLPDVLDAPDAAADLLDRLDREAAAEIRRLTSRRAVIAVLREHGATSDLPLDHDDQRVGLLHPERLRGD